MNIAFFLHTSILVLAPVWVPFIAGILRQDRLPRQLNEAISYAIIIFIAILQTFIDVPLTGSIITDFILCAAYATATLHTSYGQELQQAVQSNILNIQPSKHQNSTQEEHH